ncbi:MAG: glutamate--tRNA ligase [Desulfurispora sp.]|uniref:glutamate--tRNA ligase n=1 Tax=Desulfurispora sp. TaxID=3014275 RepID=UPI00404B2E42
MSAPVRVRFAPSPTGPLHIGGARSALFNWLFARRYGGKFIVRMEDTDLDRSSRQSEQEILTSLRWLGLDWDEGIEVGGPHAPYRQTERLEIYRKYTDLLLRSGQAYYCFCTEEELAAEREAQLARGITPVYSGRCRHLSGEQKQVFLAQGRRPVVRFAVPAGRVLTVDDLVRGEVHFESEGIGDFIIVKSDGIPTYNFAVVVDDHEMGITHVIRAEEHLSNTPRQILIYEALGWSCPQFAHVSLILGQDRSKMSKRHGATSIEQYREMGYLPEALVNFLALLGWSPGGEEEVLSLEEIKTMFSLDRVAKNPAVFDLDKLNWLNGHYIRQADLDRLTTLALPYLVKAGCAPANPTAADMRRLKRLMVAVRPYLSCLAEIELHLPLYFADSVEPADEEARQALTGEHVPGVLAGLADKLAGREEIDETEARTILKSLPGELRLPGKKVYVPLRVALTGRTHGPELHQFIPALGPQRALQRLVRAGKIKI